MHSCYYTDVGISFLCFPLVGCQQDHLGTVWVVPACLPAWPNRTQDATDPPASSSNQSLCALSVKKKSSFPCCLSVMFFIVHPCRIISHINGLSTKHISVIDSTLVTHRTHITACAINPRSKQERHSQNKRISTFFYCYCCYCCLYLHLMISNL